MATVGDDCYFFCTSTCSKGVNCPFRHVEAAKTCRIICQHWQMGGCLRPACKFRHSDFHIQINPTEIACFWESQPTGCKKLNCPYKHSKPRPQLEDTTKAAANPSSQSESISTENGTNNSTLKFITPVVEPVVIEPADSEASNSSPVKSVDKRKSDDQKESSTEGEKETRKDDVQKEEKISPVKTKKKKKSVTPKKPQKGNLKKNTEKAPPKKKLAAAKKGTNQKKGEKISSPKEVKKRKVPPKKVGVKERLGTARKEPEQSVQEKYSDSDSTDSDDSIENVKVLSMEEIFRQKALESMMKKRAAEGKPMLPPSATAVKKPGSAASKLPPKKVIQSPKREPPKPKKEQIKQEEEEEEESDAEEEDEDSEEEEEEEEDEEEEEETEDEEEDSTESSSYESSESEEEIEAPRRVIIDIDDNEKHARRKKVNKNNLQKRPLTKPDVKARKREVIREPLFGEEPPLKKSKSVAIKRPSDIRRRLGKPVSESNDHDDEEKSKKFAIKRKLIVEDERFLEDSEKSDEDANLGVIKIKTLEEIRAEKARKLQDNNQLSPRRERPVSETIQPPKRTIMLKDEDKESALSDPGPAGNAERKAKKRPWKRQKTSPPQQEEGDHRTVSATAPKSADDDFQNELEQYKANQKKEESPPESPMESLRRRALLKKVLSQGILQESEEVLKKSHSKKSKHKHKHKKRSKIERQLYIPPALKSSGGKSLPLDEEKTALSDEDKLQDSTGASDDASEKVAPQRAVAQRVGALWAAGLNAPSKGLGLRNVPKKEIVKDIVKETKPLVQKAEPIPLSRKAPRDDSLPTIKTFSQIMAEKKQKRLLLQQQGKKADPSPESIPASLIKSESNPRVPISPIVFNSGDASKQLTKSSLSSVRASLKTPSGPPSEDKTAPSRLSGQVKRDLNASNLRPEKSKKLFKKPISKEVALDSDLDSPPANKHSQSLETSSKEEMDVKSAAKVSSAIPPFLSEKDSISSTEKTQKRHSIEDEFSFFEDDDLDELTIPEVSEDAEPIDDLLQDIDSLLA